MRIVLSCVLAAALGGCTVTVDEIEEPVELGEPSTSSQPNCFSSVVAWLPACYDVCEAYFDSEDCVVDLGSAEECAAYKISCYADCVVLYCQSQEYDASYASASPPDPPEL